MADPELEEIRKQRLMQMQAQFKVAITEMCGYVCYVLNKISTGRKFKH